MNIPGGVWAGLRRNPGVWSSGNAAGKGSLVLGWQQQLREEDHGAGGNCIRGSLDPAAAAMPVTVTGLSSCAVTAKAGD